jgi:hypothetical protein
MWETGRGVRLPGAVRELNGSRTPLFFPVSPHRLGGNHAVLDESIVAPPTPPGVPCRARGEWTGSVAQRPTPHDTAPPEARETWPGRVGQVVEDHRIPPSPTPLSPVTDPTHPTNTYSEAVCEGKSSSVRSS